MWDSNPLPPAVLPACFLKHLPTVCPATAGDNPIRLGFQAAGSSFSFGTAVSVIFMSYLSERISDMTCITLLTSNMIRPPLICGLPGARR